MRVFAPAQCLGKPLYGSLRNWQQSFTERSLCQEIISAVSHIEAIQVSDLTKLLAKEVPEVPRKPCRRGKAQY